MTSVGMIVIPDGDISRIGMHRTSLWQTRSVELAVPGAARTSSGTTRASLLSRSRGSCSTTSQPSTANFGAANCLGASRSESGSLLPRSSSPSWRLRTVRATKPSLRLAISAAQRQREGDWRRSSPRRANHEHPQDITWQMGGPLEAGQPESVSHVRSEIGCSCLRRRDAKAVAARRDHPEESWRPNPWPVC